MLKYFIITTAFVALAAPAWSNGPINSANAQYNRGMNHMSTYNMKELRESRKEAFESVKNVSQLDSSEIRALQTALQTHGYNPGKADGIWGKKTAQALKKFQKSRNIDSSAGVSEETIAALGIENQVDIGTEDTELAE